MRLIKGSDLNARQRSEVLSAFIYRCIDKTSKTEDEWLAKHAFFFIESGARLAKNRRYCVPLHETMLKCLYSERSMRLPERTNGALPTYAWPRGYPIYYLASDNGVLCPKCANEYTVGRDTEEQLKPVAADINWEDSDPMTADDMRDYAQKLQWVLDQTWKETGF